MRKTTTILAIETSCDETSFAIVEGSGDLSSPRFTIKKHLISSQIEVHRPFGGVVPNLAKREHLKNLPFLYNQLRFSGMDMKKIDMIAVTVGPGLEPALWTGINFAKALGKAHDKPVMGINHLEGHMYSFLATKNIKLGDAFPGICLLVSGGHTLLMHMRSLIKWNIIGTTLDDAVGESYDKVARLIDLPYPGGPEIEKLAKDGDPNTVTFPRPMMHHKNYDFSFSGLKTAVLYFVKKRVRKTQKFKTDVAASFQAAAIDVLTHKTKLAIEAHNARSLVLAGGVAGNKTLRGALNALAKEKQITFFVPEGTLNTDNAAMIGMAAYIKALQGKKRGLPLRAEGNLSL